MKKWIVIGLFLILAGGLYAASTDYKVLNNGTVFGWTFVSKLNPADVRAYMDGVSGRPTYATWYANQATTDVTTALQAASDAATGEVVFPSGIFAISASLALKTNTTYRGPASGTMPSGQEHPVSGYGASLKWIGTASGTMVKFYDVIHTTWDGIDLDGVDYTNNVRGFWVYSNGSPTTQNPAIRNFRAYNLGEGIRFGDYSVSGNHNQADKTVVDRFSIYMVNYGIVFDGYNAGQGVNVSNGFIGPYTQGVRFYVSTGLINFKSVFFGGLGNAPADGCYYYFNNVVQGGTINIDTHQGEPQGGGTGWKDFRFADVPASFATAVINLSNSVMDGGIVCPVGVNYKLNSKGNYWVTYEDDGITGGGGAHLSFDGDNFLATTAMVHDEGVNNMVTYKNCYELTTPDYKIYEYYYNGALVFKLPWNGAPPIFGAGTNKPTGTVTLTPNAASTTVNHTGVTANSLIFLFPVTANAAADLGSATSVWISAKVAATSFTITHPNNANADKTFNYWIIN